MAILDICIPVYKSVDVRTFVSFFMLRMPNVTRRLFVEHGTTGDIAAARNVLVKKIVEAEEPAEFSLWFDADVSFDQDSLAKLMGIMDVHHDAGIITGLTRGRTQPHDIVCMHFNKRECNYYGAFSHLKGKDIPHSVMEVDACGADFMLVRNEVFRGPNVCHFERMDDWSEDLSFCHRVKKAGYKILAHGDVRIGHQTEITLAI